MILFLKAAIPGGAAGDLFAGPVRVKGHTTKAGVYVAPYTATKKVRHPPPAPHPAAAKVDLLTADEATYFQAVYDAALARLDAGGHFQVATSLRNTVFSKPEHKSGIRLANGELYVARGRSWDALGKMGQAIDSLAGSLGLPTTYQRMKHAMENTDHEAEAVVRRNQGIELGPLIDAHEAAGDAWRADMTLENEAAHDAARRALEAKGKTMGLVGFRLQGVVDDYLEAKGQ